MNHIHDSSQLLMSDAIKNSIADMDLSEFEDKFIMVEVSVVVDSGIEKVNSSLFGCTFSEEFMTLELKVVYEDAVGLSEAWSNITIKDFCFRMKEKIIHDGPFKIKSFSIKNLVPEQRMCVIVVQLYRV